MKRVLITAALTFLVILPVLYAVLWHAVVAPNIRDWIRTERERAALNGVTIDGDLPVVTGFPGTPEVRFSGRVMAEGRTVVIPALSVKSFFIEGMPIRILLPEGLYVDQAEGLDRDIWSLQYLMLNGALPPQLPELEEKSVRAWHDAGGDINLRAFMIKKDTLTIAGSGRLWLDEGLQPAGMLSAQITGYGDFLTFLQRKKLIEPQQSFLVGVVLNGLSTLDPETGNRVLAGKLMLDGRQLTMGPATLITFPVIHWPRRVERLPGPAAPPMPAPITAPSE